MRINLKSKENILFSFSPQNKKTNLFLKKHSRFSQLPSFISPNKKYYKKGFTLLELLIALVVLAIAVLGVAHALTVVSTNRALSYHITVASNLAQDKLEEIKRLAYTHGDLNGSSVGITHPDLNNPINETGQNEIDAIYNRSWIVWTNTPINGTKAISVTVSWPSTGDATHTVTLYTIKRQ